MHPRADLEFHLDRDNVFQQCIDVIVGQCRAPFATKIFPLVKRIIQPAEVCYSSEAKGPLFPCRSQFFIGSIAVDTIPP